jgi:hypothetical protein
MLQGLTYRRTVRSIITVVGTLKEGRSTFWKVIVSVIVSYSDPVQRQSLLPCRRVTFLPRDAKFTDYGGIFEYVIFKVFTAVAMKNGVFWDVAPCGSCKNRRFGGT